MYVATSNVRFFVHFVDRRGFHVNEAKIDAIKKVPVLTNSMELRSFLAPFASIGCLSSILPVYGLHHTQQLRGTRNSIGLKS